MALTGHLSDLSLSELIEFFCNQRKTGQLKVLYPQGPGYFYLQTGSVIDARIGVMRGIDAVYYALTLPNANFEFSASSEATDRTINQPWTQVVLEGLRRLDEGMIPVEAFPAGYEAESNEPEPKPQKPARKVSIHDSRTPAFLSFIDQGPTSRRKPLLIGSIVVALLGSLAVVGIPAGWYGRPKAPVAVSEPVNPVPAATQIASPVVSETPQVQELDTTNRTNDAALVAKRQRERDKNRARDETGAVSTPTPSSSANTASEAAKAGPKKILVTVTYDESGRVTQASGGDETARRIARQKHFPPGKAGSATISIN